MLKFSFFILQVSVLYISLISGGLSNPAGHWRDDLIGQCYDSLAGLSSIKVHAREEKFGSTVGFVGCSIKRLFSLG